MVLFVSISWLVCLASIISRIWPTIGQVHAEFLFEFGLSNND
ncbi:hypothetical protein GLYMA_09G127051v4 [Glycine max]|nr:hypothetical protein GLYMA_09G127051v4 [Glycine max]KAH1042752.1 hypothetical protein GYH30_024861 [Glycine max]